MERDPWALAACHHGTAPVWKDLHRTQVRGGELQVCPLHQFHQTAQADSRVPWLQGGGRHPV